MFPESAHVAIIKACQYFCIDARIAPINPRTFKADVKEMKKLIDSNTIMVIPHFIIIIVIRFSSQFPAWYDG